MKLPSDDAGSIHLENNLFLGFCPEGQAGSEVDAITGHLKDGHGLTGNPQGLSRYHVSLYSLGKLPIIPPDIAAKLGEVFAPFAAEMAPFDVCLDRALTFKINRSKHPFVLVGSEKNPPLMRFHRKLGALLGLRRQSFTPHLTMLWDAKLVAERPVQPVRWTVTKLVLVHSYVGLSRHQRLASWPLCGRLLCDEQMDLPF